MKCDVSIYNWRYHYRHTAIVNILSYLKKHSSVNKLINRWALKQEEGR